MFRTLYILLLALHILGYAQICPKPTGTELITNGNFEKGADGTFTSSYSQVSGNGNLGPNSWAVGTDPQAMDNSGTFTSIGDHTTGSGNMMVIDADGTLTKFAYQTTVNVIPNTTYFFSAWFVNIGDFSNATPELQFYINGLALGAKIVVSNSTTAWQQFFVIWNSGTTSGNIPIRMQNMVSTSTGNDLAIDDISFSTSCEKIVGKYGRSSVLPDSVFICETASAISLNPGLTTATHSFDWKSSSSTSLASTATFTVPISPIPSYNKLYVCYDSLTDGIVCPKLDSVVVVKNVRVKLGPDVALCEPISQTITATPNTAGATYAWARNTVATGTNSNILSASLDGTYRVTVSKSGCGTASDDLIISKIPSPLATKGFYCNAVSPEEGFFTLNGATRINNTLNIKWYNQPSGGVAITNTKLNDSTIKVTSAVFANISTCARAMWAEDLNSFKTSVSLPLSSPYSNSDISDPVGRRQRILVKAGALMIDSISFYINQNSSQAAQTTPFQFFIFSNTNLVTPIWSSPIYNFNNVNTDVLKTIPVGFSLTGTPAGTTYWITATGRVEFFGDTPAFPYTSTDPSGVLSVTGSWRNSDVSTSRIGFINQIKATSGKPSACGRYLVCADVLNCTLPINFLYFDIKSTSYGYELAWNVAQKHEVKEFVVEASTDGLRFEAVANAHVGNQYKLYGQELPTESEHLYYRIKCVDMNGKVTYSNVKAIESNASAIKVYPNPSSEGFNIEADCSGIFTIFAVNGSTVHSGSFENNFAIKADELKSGIYILKLKSSDSFQTFKIIKN